MRLLAPWLCVVLASGSAARAQSTSGFSASGARRGSVPDGFRVADYMAPAEGRMRLTFESDGRAQFVVLERRLRIEAVDSHGVYHAIIGSGTCRTPCVMFVPPGPVQLRTHGGGLRDGSFDLTVPTASSRVLLRAASRATYDLGTGLVAAGAIVFLAEALVAAIAQGVGSSSPPPVGVESNNLPVLTPAVAITVAGVACAFLAAGIPLLLSHRTGIRQVTFTQDRPP